MVHGRLNWEAPIVSTGPSGACDLRSSQVVQPSEKSGSLIGSVAIFKRDADAVPARIAIVSLAIIL